MDETSLPEWKKYQWSSASFTDHMDYYFLRSVPDTTCSALKCSRPRCYSIDFEEEYDVCSYRESWTLRAPESWTLRAPADTPDHFTQCAHCIGVANMPKGSQGESAYKIPLHGVGLETALSHRPLQAGSSRPPHNLYTHIPDNLQTHAPRQQPRSPPSLFRSIPQIIVTFCE